MVTTGERAGTLETSVNPNYQKMNEDEHIQIQAQKICGYEQFREERIRENLERMKKLGIPDLSIKLKSLKPNPKNSLSNRRTPQRLSPLPTSGPVRRSSRLQNATPVSYSEVHLANKEESLESEDELERAGLKPEVYTEEHEMLLGDTNMDWTLFVDGYGKDGKRIYDSINGKTCHQCRQKTLGHRTHCSKCNMLHGQFCGDCLYMRYGENVLEAKQNPNWVCPVCRGICNCSFCRQAKGWPPTGILYKKVSNLGFKSVAHYLIQTHRPKTDLEKDSGTKIPVSAKRSLPFNDTEATSPEKESLDSNNDLPGLVKPESEDNKTNVYFKSEKEEGMKFSEREHGDRNVKLESCPKPIKYGALAAKSGNDNQVSLKPESEENIADDEFKKNQEENIHFLDNKHWDSNVALESSPKPIKNGALNAESGDDTQLSSKPESEENIADDEFKRKQEENMHFLGNKESSPVSKRKTPIGTEATPDSVAGILRQRRKGYQHDKLAIIGINEETLDAKQAVVNSIISESKAEANTNCSSSISTIPHADSIAGRLRLRRKRT